MLTFLNPFDIPSLPAERKLSLQWEVGRHLPEPPNTRCVRPSGAVEAPLTSLVQVAHTCLPSPLISDSEATSIAARALRVHSLTES